MPVTTASQFRDEFTAMFAPDANTTAQALVQAILDQATVYHVEQPADVYTNTGVVVAPLINTTHSLDLSTAVRLRVNAFRVNVGASVTADNTNLANIALVYNNANGGADTVIAFSNTANANGGGSGTITAGTPFAFTINAANSVIPVGSLVQIKVVKAGGGVALPATTFEVKASAV